MELNASDRIHVEQLQIPARLGITSDERAQPQPIALNLTIWPKTAFDRLQDDIEKTINYVELCDAIRRLVETQEWNLIETVASKVASHLLEQFPLNAVEIEVRKFVLPNTKHVAVTTRKHGDAG